MPFCCFQDFFSFHKTKKHNSILVVLQSILIVSFITNTKTKAAYVPIIISANNHMAYEQTLHLNGSSDFLEWPYYSETQLLCPCSYRAHFRRYQEPAPHRLNWVVQTLHLARCQFSISTALPAVPDPFKTHMCLQRELSVKQCSPYTFLTLFFLLLYSLLFSCFNFESILTLLYLFSKRHLRTKSSCQHVFMSTALP